MLTVAPNKQLICGCCGIYFRTWDDYSDQDQDKGFGICMVCQEDAEERITAYYDSAWKNLLKACTKKETRDKLLTDVEKDPEMKTVYVNLALRDGMLKWQIK
jgi:hypothetical protein